MCKTKIKLIIIPNGVVEIQDSAFRDSRNLKEVIFEAGSALKKIGDDAFWNCMYLRNIQFPDGLEAIGINCFWNNSLEQVVLPISVKNIGSRAF